MTGPKRCDAEDIVTDPDGETPTIDRDAEDTFTDPDGGTPTIDRDAEDTVTDPDGGTPTIDRECRATDDETDSDEGRDALCHSVCPDGTIIGPHDCAVEVDCLAPPVKQVNPSEEHAATEKVRRAGTRHTKDSRGAFRAR